MAWSLKFLHKPKDPSLGPQHQCKVMCHVYSPSAGEEGRSLEAHRPADIVSSRFNERPYLKMKVAGKRAQWIKVFAAKSTHSSSILGSTRWKESTDLHNLSSDSVCATPIYSKYSSLIV